MVITQVVYDIQLRYRHPFGGFKVSQFKVVRHLCQAQPLLL